MNQRASGFMKPMISVAKIDTDHSDRVYFRTLYVPDAYYLGDDSRLCEELYELPSKDPALYKEFFTKNTGNKILDFFITPLNFDHPDLTSEDLFITPLLMVYESESKSAGEVFLKKLASTTMEMVFRCYLYIDDHLFLIEGEDDHSAFCYDVTTPDAFKLLREIEF